MPSSNHTRSRGLVSIVAAVALTASTAGALGGGAGTSAGVVVGTGTGARTGVVVGVGTGATTIGAVVGTGTGATTTITSPPAAVIGTRATTTTGAFVGDAGVGFVIQPGQAPPAQPILRGYVIPGK